MQTPAIAVPVPGEPRPPTGEPLPSGSQEPLREPVIPQFQPRPLPPVPSLQRLGVGSESLPLSLNDAIKRAIENNNDIEVARDDVRIAETQLRALEGIFDPVFAVTPTYDKRISPQQSSLGGGSGNQHNDVFVQSFSCEAVWQRWRKLLFNVCYRQNEHQQQFQFAESVLLIEPVVTVYATTVA